MWSTIVCSMLISQGTIISVDRPIDGNNGASLPEGCGRKKKDPRSIESLLSFYLTRMLSTSRRILMSDIVNLRITA